LTIVLALGLAVAIAAVGVLWTRLGAARERVEALTAVHDEALRQVRADLDVERQRVETAQREASDALQQKAALEARLDEAAQRGLTFEMLKAEMMQASNAALATTAERVSTQLLVHHKRENETLKAEGEQRVKATTEQLTQRVEQLTRILAQLQGKVDADSKALGTMMRALSHPSGAGSHAEDILANTLRLFELEEPRDFILQYATQNIETGARLRPDAIVFLPGDGVLVVDVKASKHLLAIAEAEGSEGEDAAYRDLARTMRQHLKALAAKDYRSAVADDCRRSGRPAVGRVWTLMFLSSDGALEKLRRADRSFFEEAARLDVMVAGPTVLSCAIQLARSHILSARQLENQERIVDASRSLLDGIVIVLDHAEKVGRGIKTAAENYERFTNSVNKTLLSRARKLDAYGVRAKKPVPPALPAYQVLVADNVIDGEAEEVEQRLSLVRIAGE
jgi:DNA recombination protein RmuC